MKLLDVPGMPGVAILLMWAVGCAMIFGAFKLVFMAVMTAQGLL